MNTNWTLILLALIIFSFIAYLWTLATIDNLNNNPFVFEFKMDNNTLDYLKFINSNNSIGSDSP